MLEKHELREVRLQVGRGGLRSQLGEEIGVETRSVERGMAVVRSCVGHNVVNKGDCQGKIGVEGRVVRFEDDEAVLAREERDAGGEVFAVVEGAVDEERVGALHEGQIVSVIGHHVEVIAVETQVIEVIPLTKVKRTEKTHDVMAFWILARLDVKKEEASSRST